MNNALKQNVRNFPFIKEKLNYLIFNSDRLNYKGKIILNELINKILDEWQEKEQENIKTKKYENSKKKELNEFIQ